MIRKKNYKEKDVRRRHKDMKTLTESFGCHIMEIKVHDVIWQNDFAKNDRTGRLIMRIDFAQFIKSLSIALDYAEKTILEIAPLHGMRVALLTNRMAESLGFDKDKLFSLTQAALLHDCALSEYISDELPGKGNQTFETYMAAHCIKGEEMLKKLPFYANVQGAVLYHHERADGSGALGMNPAETPFYSQLMHLADQVDVRFSLFSYDEVKYQKILIWIEQNAEKAFTQKCTEDFFNSVDCKMLQSISGEGSKTALDQLLPQDRMIDVSVETLKEMASVFADITDYKSHFTWRHSMGIAEKAKQMGKYYLLSDIECEKLYIAGALHDIGKLLISNDILEKPEKLSPEEYEDIRNHALGTWDLLHNIAGLEDIARWAALHHEKLDGSGYPFGYTGAELDKNARLMACLDIYQALVENRPYKAGMSHLEAVGILKKMGTAGQLDSEIINDIDLCFAARDDNQHESKQTPVPQAQHEPAYRCPVCGYLYEGVLPEDFICPQCEQPGSIFERV